MTDRLSLPPRYRRMVDALLREHVPDADVWAYGSRVNGQSHEGSDLDLVVRGPGLEPLGVEFIDLVEALQESNIPVLVQAHDWARLPESFHREIERDYVVVQESHPSNDGWLYSPTFPTHWQRMPLHSMAEWVNGLAFRNIQFSPTGMPVIKIAEIKNGISGQTRFTEQMFDESVRLRPGDLLFSWSGQPETSIDAFWWTGPEGWLNQHIYRVTPQPYVDASFFFYLLRYLKPNFVGIASNKQTTGLGHVTKSDLEEITAALPPLSEQRAIAHVLGTLDDKIELNRRMNQTLEAMARALFKSWFVDFEPVRAKMEGRWRRGESLPGLPAEHYDLFPDRLVDSELGEIPEGWEVKQLGELVELAYGKALRAVDRKDGPIPVFGSNGQVGWHHKKLVSGPGIVVGRKGNPGVVTWAHGDFFPIDTTFYVAQRDANVDLPFLLFALTHQDLPAVSADSAVPGLNRNLAYMNNQLVPDKRVLDEFDYCASAILSRCHRLEDESRILATQRDALLPMLVSGEVVVSP